MSRQQAESGVSAGWSTPSIRTTRRCYKVVTLVLNLQTARAGATTPLATHLPVSALLYTYSVSTARSRAGRRTGRPPSRAGGARGLRLGVEDPREDDVVAGVQARVAGRVEHADAPQPAAAGLVALAGCRASRPLLGEREQHDRPAALRPRPRDDGGVRRRSARGGRRGRRSGRRRRGGRRLGSGQRRAGAGDGQAAAGRGRDRLALLAVARDRDRARRCRATAIDEPEQRRPEPGAGPRWRSAMPADARSTAPAGVPASRRPHSRQYSWPGSTAAQQRGQRSCAGVAHFARSAEPRAGATGRPQFAQKREPQSSGAPHSQRAVRGVAGAGTPVAEQRVELVDARLEPDQVGAALEQQVLAEAVAPVHLEREPAEIAQLLLTQAQERAPLAPELAGGRGGPSPPWRGRRDGAFGCGRLRRSSRCRSGTRTTRRVY